jgi:endonuclease/exonuclease/phosphatase family metal-dependent hydrolase
MSAQQSPALLKVASLNTWHGLNGQGTFLFGQLESRTERIARLERQVACLKSLGADIVLLQEVNPLPFRAHWYAQKLGLRVEYAACNSGVKLGWGPPGNLNEGLAILFPSHWKCESLGRKQLSGSFRLNPLRLSAIAHPFLSLQLTESRVATAVRVTIPNDRQIEGYQGRNTVLIAVTHLHVSHAHTPENEKILAKALQDGRLFKEDAKQLVKHFRNANARRMTEADQLLSWLETLKRPDEPALLAGDFNCVPNSSPYNAVIRRGWHDLWTEAGNSEDILEAATWDTPRNTLTQRVRDFQHMRRKNKERIVSVLNEADTVPRRIDFIFGLPCRKSPGEHKFELGVSGPLRRVARFGYLTGNPLTSESVDCQNFESYKTRMEFENTSGSDAQFISDHFGLVAEFGAGTE